MAANAERLQGSGERRLRTVHGGLLSRAALLWLFSVATCHAQTGSASPSPVCGEAVTIATHGTTTTRYALAQPSAASAVDKPVALVLLPGGGGHVDLDEKGCIRALAGNFLVRSLAHFHAAGFITALVDAPSDHPGEEGLAGFRVSAQHAQDLGKIIADVRARTRAAVWVIGTSRGTISAANAASRLAGLSGPDGVVLTSAVSSGGSSRQRPWVGQSVFDLSLDAIRIPVLIVGHAADGCMRTPPGAMANIARRLTTHAKQVATVTAAAAEAAAPSIDACAGLTPHGFIDQEAEVIAGIGRFIRGGRY